MTKVSIPSTRLSSYAQNVNVSEVSPGDKVMVSGKVEKSTPSIAVLKRVSTAIGIFISTLRFADLEKIIWFSLQPSTTRESLKEFPTFVVSTTVITGPFKELSSKNTAELKALSLTLANFSRMVYQPPHSTSAVAVNLSV